MLAQARLLASLALVGGVLLSAPAVAGCNPSTQEIADSVPGGRGGAPTSGRGKTVGRPDFGSASSGGGYNPAGAAGSAGLVGAGVANVLGGLSGLIDGARPVPLSPRCEALKERANNAAAAMRENDRLAVDWDRRHGGDISSCDAEGYGLMTQRISLAQQQKRSFDAALSSGCDFHREGSSIDLDGEIAKLQQTRNACRAAMASRHTQGAVRRETASADYGSPDAWKRKCERLEQQRQIEASSCWAGLAGSTMLVGNQPLVDYAKGRMAELARTGPQGEDAQETMPIAPGCNEMFPIRRTGVACRGVEGAITVGTHTACCVATRSLRERLRERLQNSSN